MQSERSSDGECYSVSSENHDLESLEPSVAGLSKLNGLDTFQDSRV